MKAQALITLAILAATQLCSAQVRSDGRIELTGTDADQRQVRGVPTLNLPDAVLNAELELSGAHRYATPEIGTTWQVDLPALEQPPVAGTHFMVRAPQPTDGPVQIMINEHGPFAVLFGTSELLQGASIPEGTTLSLVFDGSALQVTNGSGHGLRNCPAGMVAVNDQYCIQITQHPTATEFWEAIENCGITGQRLCSWSEYFTACLNAAALGITDMPNGEWEWTNQTANEDNSVRLVGVPSCYGAGTGFTQPTLRRHRCCFSR